MAPGCGNGNVSTVRCTEWYLSCPTASDALCCISGLPGLPLLGSLSESKRQWIELLPGLATGTFDTAEIIFKIEERRAEGKKTG